MSPLHVDSKIDVNDSFKCPIFCCVGKKKKRHHKNHCDSHIEDRVDDIAGHKLKRSQKSNNISKLRESDGK